ncbi:zinc finger protein 436-like [Wyeomyia smithii]|uniref:zinc finger protein 436-like n=1 Tax=Wyeomyia smithii TaxID=174621 RepID=UPI002467EE1B|nr:zinc finger protein 436-like [Wyeomyia smithii]
MESFSVDKNYSLLCRVCAKVHERMTPLFSMLEDVLIANIITEFTAVQIQEDDGLPENVCAVCVSDIQQFIAFIERARKSDRSLRKMFKGEVKSDLDRMMETEIVDKDSQPIEELDLEAVKIETLSQDSEEELQDFEDADCAEFTGDDRSCELDGPKIEETQTDRTNDEASAVKQKKRRRKRGDDGEFDEAPELETLDEIELKTFQVINVGDKLVCCTCYKLYDTADEVKKHGQKEHVSSRRSKSTKKHICEFCLRGYCSATALKMHRKKVYSTKKVYDCLKCPTRFTATKSRRNHAHQHPVIKTKSSIIVVPIPLEEQEKLGKICCSRQCSEVFETEEQLLNHAADVHRANKIHSDLISVELRPVECPVCFKRFADKHGLKCHQQRIYAPKKYVCSICGQKFLNVNQLQRHEREHRNEKIFKCELCPKAYFAAEHLKAHTKRHSATREHMCNICGQSYLQKHSLQTHMLMHEGKLPFECDICGKAFRTKAKLIYHARVHTGVKPYQCRYCDKAFADSTNRMRHEMSHTGVKPYKCDHCEKTFITKRLKREHESTHTGQKPYRCTECLVSFSTGSALKSHNTTMHCDTLEVDYT